MLTIFAFVLEVGIQLGLRNRGAKARAGSWPVERTTLALSSMFGKDRIFSIFRGRFDSRLTPPFAAMLGRGIQHSLKTSGPKGIGGSWPSGGTILRKDAWNWHTARIQNPWGVQSSVWDRGPLLAPLFVRSYNSSTASFITRIALDQRRVRVQLPP